MVWVCVGCTPDPGAVWSKMSVALWRRYRACGRKSVHGFLKTAAPWSLGQICVHGFLRGAAAPRGLGSESVHSFLWHSGASGRVIRFRDVRGQKGVQKTTIVAKMFPSIFIASIRVPSCGPAHFWAGPKRPEGPSLRSGPISGPGEALMELWTP